MYIQQRLQQAQKLIDSLEQSTGTGTEDELNILSDLEQMVGENPTLIHYQSIISNNAGFVVEAQNYLKACLKKYPFSYDLQTIMYEISRFIDDRFSTITALSQMYKLAATDELKDEILLLLEAYILDAKISTEELSTFFDYFRAESSSLDYRSYPINEYGDSIIRQNAFPGRDEGNSYLANMYKTIQVTDVDNVNRIYFLYETIKGTFINALTNIPAKKGDIIAISSATKNSTFTNLVIENLDDAPYNVTLEPNLIRYFKIKQNNEIHIEADKEIFVSHFKKNILANKPKLVLQIFIDGLSFQFVKDSGFEELMPNTFNFFKKGYVNYNCHANGEWTLPSLMSMSTGKYTTNHYVYNTTAPHKGEELNKFVQEYFVEAGYMTGRICSNWRGTPSYGYFKSTNRNVYSPMIDRMNCSEIVTETLEHLETFQDFYNHVWVTIEDLHSVADGFTRGAFSDTNIDCFYNDNDSNDSEISVFRTYNERKIEEYKATFKKIDFYLGILYDYVLKTYDEDDFVLMINSDHGQKFIEEEDYMFTQKRTNVPFLIRGLDVPCQVSDELMSNVDILPTLLKICKMQCNDPIDGRIMKDFGGTERDYTITESIFPGQTYKIAINDTVHLFTFETKEYTRNDGLIPMKEYTVKLKNRATGDDETEKYPDKIERYCQITFEHVKEWIAF
jgi:hypothetical protein